MTKTLLLTQRHKSIAQLFNENFWKAIQGGALSKSGGSAGIILVPAIVKCTLPKTANLQTVDWDLIEKYFLNPPDSSKPWVFWFWMNGNITEKGITLDLEAMKRMGIGGAIS